MRYFSCEKRAISFPEAVRVGFFCGFKPFIRMTEHRPAIENLLLYRELQAERDEILRHKWIESERAGRDIGFDKALLDWVIRHRAAWRRAGGK